MAMIFGWIIIVPPFIAMYNTAKHVRSDEERLASQPQLEPALVIVIMLVFSHRQRHLHPGTPEPHLGPLLRRVGRTPRSRCRARSGTTPMPGPPSS